ncbi:hypothetical protein [Coprothermobacter platensis]|uniref:hypothetical protein n=1 Tax=Coprothermobacter platensis TaxID=108819 RepID=UPI001FDF619D|nr:hypothetical protein [Coprothermobacter platensis]
MVMGSICALFDGEQLSIELDEKETFIVEPEDEIREEPWGFALGYKYAQDLSVYRYARYMGKNLIVCFGPWNENSFDLFNRTWIGIQENQLAAIEVFQHEEGSFIVGVVPVDMSPDRTGIIQPLEDKLSISMNAIYETRSKYMLLKMMNPDLYLKYERYLLEGVNQDD